MAKLKRLPPKARPYIDEWRQYRDLRWEDLGDRVGWHRSTLQRARSGKLAYTQQMLETLAAVLHCETIDLLHGPPQALKVQLRHEVESLSTNEQQELLEWIAFKKMRRKVS